MARARQRGASLTGYALIMATMVAGSLTAIKGLEEGSTEVLDATGDSIGEARPTRDELAASIDEEDPDGGPIDGPDEDPDPTYSWQSEYTGVISAQGFCLTNVGGEPKTAACTTASDASFEFFENADDDNDNVQLRQGGLCVTRVNDNQPTVLAACQDGNDDQMWLQTPSGNLANAGSPGQCLDVEGSKQNTGDARIFSYGCHGNANQSFTFPGPYVPPAPAEVTSVNASSATLTGNFVLDSDGFVSAPAGNGYNGTPGAGGTATFTFTVTDAGQYRVSGTVIAPNGGDDSFWVTTSLDGNSESYLWDTANSSTAVSDFVNNRSSSSSDVVLDVPAGTTFTVVVSHREDGTRLSNLSLVPM